MNSRFRILLPFIALAIAAPTQSQRIPIAQRLGREAHEEEDGRDPYLPPAGGGTRTFAMQVTRNGYTSYQVNVGAGQLNIANDAANEPSLAVDFANPDRIVVGWRQFDNVASNFRQAGWAYSTDRGLTWTFPGSLDAGVFRSDPVLAFDPDSHFQYNSLQQTFATDQWESQNGGATFARLASSFGGDKQWMTIDAGNSTGRGNAYQAWSTAGNPTPGKQFSRSRTNGSSWETPVALPGSPIWGTMDVDLVGNVYVGGTQNGTAFYCNKSTNAKTSATVTFSQSTTHSLGGEIDFQIPVNPGGLLGQHNLVVDRSNAASSGYVYSACSVFRNSSNPSDVMFARSTNGGSTFSTPLRVNNDAQNTTKYHWMAQMGCSPTGRIDLVWLDTRESSNNSLSALYWSYSIDGGATWSANVAISPTFNHSLGYPNQNKMGDYLGVVSLADGAYVAYPGTFTGGEDVYFVRIPAPAIPVTGTVFLQNFVASTTGQIVQIEVRDAGTSTVRQTASVPLGSGGSFSFNLSPELANLSLDISVKGTHWLRSKLTAQAVPLAGKSGLSYSLTNGDVDGDNVVSIIDYIDLSDAFDSTPGDAHWNPMADLDGDGVVSVFDYIVLSDNFDEEGA